MASEHPSTTPSSFIAAMLLAVPVSIALAVSATVLPSDADLARIVFDALHRANPKALLMGDPTDRLASAVLVDGNFNFRMVAKHIKARLKEMPGA